MAYNIEVTASHIYVYCIGICILCVAKLVDCGNCVRTLVQAMRV